jgi:hypothetical protein
MPSLAAVKLRHRLEAFLGRGLTIRQNLACEEIVINFKPWFPLRFLEGIQKSVRLGEGWAHNWGIYYIPLITLGRDFPGYSRRHDMIRIRGRLRRIYEQCDLMAGDGYGEKDLASAIFLTEECTDAEIHAVFTIAKTYGLRTIRHLRGIVLKNRAIVLQPLAPTRTMGDSIRNKIDQWAKTDYPAVGRLREIYELQFRSEILTEKKVRFSWENLNNSQEESDEEEAHIIYKKG